MQTRGDVPDAGEAARKKALASAIELSRRGMSERALERLAPLVVKDPKDADAWSGIGIACIRMGEYEEAADALQKAGELEPGNSAHWYNLSIAAAELGAIDLEISALERAVEANPNNVNAWNNLGVALQLVARYEEAVDCFDRVLQLDPEDVRAWSNKGVAHRHIGEHEQAMEAYTKALKLDPASIDALTNRAFLFHEMGQCHEALDAVNGLLRLRPNDVPGWYLRAECLSDIGDVVKACEALDRALSLDPNAEVVWALKERLLKEATSTPEGMQSMVGRYEAEVKVSPFNFQAWLTLALLMEWSGEDLQAKEYLVKARDINPYLTKSYIEEGRILKREGSKETALELFDVAIGIKADSEVALEEKAETLEDLGRGDEALATYRRIITINPQNYVAWSKVGVLVPSDAEGGEVDPAWLAEALEADPDNYALWTSRGALAEGEGRLDEALADYERALELNPDNARARERLDELQSGGN